MVPVKKPLWVMKLGTVFEEEKENRRGVSMDRTVKIETVFFYRLSLINW